MKHFIVPGIFLTMVIALFIYGPIPQDQDYHNFADQRVVFGIPHFMDVVTNLAFLIPGIWGLQVSSKAKKCLLRSVFISIFSGFIFLTMGSGIYHWDPDNFGLMLDRIPIAVILMGFFTFIIFDFIGKEVGQKVFIPLILTGMLSVVFWYWTELSATGDLRPYIMVQFFPVVTIPFLIILYKKQVNYLKEIYLIFGFFFMAKISEALDEQIYDLLKVLSGHNLKHIFMSFSGIFIVVLSKKRLNKK